MDLPLEHSRLLASLKDHPGFKILVHLIEEEERRLLDILSDQGDPSEALRVLRFWQFTRRLVKALKETPENAASTLARLTQEGQIPEEDQTKPLLPWTLRFRHHPDLSEPNSDGILNSEE